MTLLFTAGYSQTKRTTALPSPDTVTIFDDLYRGILPSGNGNIYTLLELAHKQYADEGTFNLDETVKNRGGRNRSLKTTGTWTVLKRYATNDNATVVELDAPGRVLFFLRKKDGNLQKLDTTLHEIKPVKNYLLYKIKETDIAAERINIMRKLSGKYTGKLPCNDCSLTETLVLAYDAHNHTANYTLTDKYSGTKKGDQANTMKGHWTYMRKAVEADHQSFIVVLDIEDPEGELHYLVKKDGNLIQVFEKDLPVKSAVDRTLKKQ